MKKILVIVAAIIAILFVIGVVVALFSGEGQKSFNKGMNDAKELVQ